jgi:hypothetical protein
VQPGTPLPLRHADRIGIGAETVLFSWPAQLQDPDTTEPLEEVAPADSAQLSSFQRQVVQSLCGPWLAGASLETLPSNEQIAAQLGTPGATGTVKAALRRIYAKAGLSDSLHTRSVAHSVASHASAAGSRKTAREHTAPSRPLRSNCEG